MGNLLYNKIGKREELFMFTYHIREDLYLKLLEPSDAQAVFALTDNSRAHLRQWLPWVDHTNEEEDTKAFIRSVRQGWADQKLFSAGIVFQGSIAGVAGFNRLDHQNNLGEIGYWLGEAYQGKGIMTAAAEAFISYGFEQLGLNKIVIKVATANEKSKAVPERLGFKQEGTLRQEHWLHDQYVDIVVYSLLNEEWKI